MILVDRDIKNYITRGKISISGYNAERLGSNSYDLTLNKILLTYRDKVLDCKEKNDTFQHEIPENGFLLVPDTLYLACTNEITSCTPDLVPCIEGKSSLGRLGLSVHVTAGFGDCGFAGSWTLEMTVVHPLMIYPDMPIAQVYWIMAFGQCEVPYGKKKSAKYKNQPVYPVASKMHLNFKDGVSTS